MTYIWCSGTCQSVNLLCNGMCQPSHPIKCPGVEYCVADVPDMCSDRILIRRRNVCPGIKEHCEKTQTICDDRYGNNILLKIIIYHSSRYLLLPIKP